MSILFGCNREESNEREGLKAMLDSHTHREQITHFWGPIPEEADKNMAYNISMARF